LRWSSPEDIRFSFICRFFNCAEFLRTAVESVYDQAHEIILVENAIDWWAERHGSDGTSTDGSHEIARELCESDTLGKIKYHGPLRFPTKDELNQFCVEQMDQDSIRQRKLVFWLLDADEVYSAAGLYAMRQAIFDHQDCTVFNTVPLHIVKDLFHVLRGPLNFGCCKFHELPRECYDDQMIQLIASSPSSWDQLHTRVVVWDADYSYARGHCTPVDRPDESGTGLHIYNPKYAPSTGRGMVVPECVRHHFGYGFSDHRAMVDKVNFYTWRDGQLPIPDVRDKAEAVYSTGAGVKPYAGPWPEKIVFQMERGKFGEEAERKFWDWENRDWQSRRDRALESIREHPDWTLINPDLLINYQPEPKCGGE